MYREDDDEIVNHPDLQMMRSKGGGRDEHTQSTREVYRDEGQESEDDDPDNAEGANIRETAPDPARIAQPFMRKGGNTGPKGVIADQKEYARRQQYIAQVRARISRSSIDF